MAQERLQAKLTQRAARLAEAQDRLAQAQADLRQARADRELASHTASLEAAGLRQQLSQCAPLSGLLCAGHLGLLCASLCWRPHLGSVVD